MGNRSFGPHNSSHRGPQSTLTPRSLPQLEPGAIRLATLQDLKWIDHLQKKFADALGFLPKAAFENLLPAGHIRLANENGDPAGYILSRPRLAWCPQMRSITQAAVAMDAQRRHHGLALLASIEQEARAQGLLAIQACCAVGLQSNEFWAAAGFVPIAHMTPDTKSQREIICWRRPLSNVLPTWFAQLPRRSGHRAKIAVSERQHGRTDATAEAAADFIAARHYEPRPVDKP